MGRDNNLFRKEHTLKWVVDNHIKWVTNELCHGNKSLAALVLGTSRRTLQRRKKRNQRGARRRRRY